MTKPSLPPLSIQRLFRDLSDAEIGNMEQASAFFRFGWRGSIAWDELLRSDRILIVSEAGAGKTYECQTQQIRLWQAGEPAFFLDLATLAGNSIRDMLSEDEEKRFEAWLRSQSEVATFFLDSIDELKLTLGNFDQALKRFNKALAGQLGRARIIITTRPVPIDRELIAKYLPIPDSVLAEPTAETFADMVMARGKEKAEDNAKSKPWRNVGLAPLSRDQIRNFAVLQGVPDPDALLADIHARDAEEFAERPQDLIELCSDWREHRRIRTHREQVGTNIATKLKPSTERKERAELSQAKASEGASRLALAAMLTRKLTLRYSADADSVDASEAALDVSKVLPDWPADERVTLLERPLFGFASYGRVRFHHRSVMEFLAAEHLKMFLDRGVPIKAIKRLLFTETAQGMRVVRPSMRPVAAWLASSCDTVFEDLVAIEPTVALDHGDPQSLRPAQRIKALEAYVGRYGSGGWRGLRTPKIQVHRFASSELSNAVAKLWRTGIENPEVRDLLLQIIGVGKLNECADIAYAVAMDGAQTDLERNLAIDALVQLNDMRLDAIGASIESDVVRWPDTTARDAVVLLFPRHISVVRLLSILQRVKENPRTVGSLNYRLPRIIQSADLSKEYIDNVRQGLTDLLVGGATWDPNKYPHLRTRNPHLIPALIAACVRQLEQGTRTEPWAMSCLFVIRHSTDRHDEGEAVAELQRAFADLPSDVREAIFWKEDAFLAGLHQSKDAWDRVFDISQNGGIRLSDEKDAVWVRKRLSNSNEPIDHREMMLWVEMVVLSHAGTNHKQVLENLRPLVADAPSLVAIIDNRLRPQEQSAELRRLEAENEKRAEHAKRREAKAHANWAMFWQEIVRDRGKVFSPDRAENTAWNLWQAMERSGNESRASGWNRRFFEAQFGKEVTDRLRETMMTAWRKDKPTLRSERQPAEKNMFLTRWQFGLAGVAAEAEDQNWAKRLTEEEAELACRYAPIELNGFPSWFESLVVEHPAVVDRVLGGELNHSLREIMDTNEYSASLQNISHASAIVVALFVPSIRLWLTEITKAASKPNTPLFELNLRQAVEILLRNGNDGDRRFLEDTAKEWLSNGLAEPFAGVWLPVLLHLNPKEGIEAIENGLDGVAVSKCGSGVQLFAQLFGHGIGGVGFDLSTAAFTPQLLLRFLRIAYEHVRVADDAHHEGPYSADPRDNAEQGRNTILSALLARSGTDGWAAKIELANDPLFAHFKDRAIALAQEKAADEADSASMTEAEFVILDNRGEAPPTTSEAMFALMRDRLDDIDDLLRQDVSPREAWAGITEERVMRRELARELRNAARQNYTVDQESVTGDEKETDIRLRSTGSGQQAAIELKLGDERSGADLFNTLSDQLLTKYMAAEECRVGCLLVTIAQDRAWEHPKTGKKIDFEALIAVLNDEAERLSYELGGTAKLVAKGLDLRPRLVTERDARAKSH